MLFLFLSVPLHSTALPMCPPDSQNPNPIHISLSVKPYRETKTAERIGPHASSPWESKGGGWVGLLWPATGQWIRKADIRNAWDFRSKASRNPSCTTTTKAKPGPYHPTFSISLKLSASNCDSFYPPACPCASFGLSVSMRVDRKLCL